MLLFVPTSLHILKLSTYGRMNQLMKLMSTRQGLRRRTLTAWLDDKKQHHSLCFSPQPRDAVAFLLCWGPTVMRKHLQPVPKPCSWRVPCLHFIHCSCELQCVALGLPPWGVFHSCLHSPAYLPKTQAVESGLNTPFDAITGNGAHVTQGQSWDTWALS